MLLPGKVTALALGLFAFICENCASAQAQQTNAPSFSETYQTAFGKAHAECNALWSNRVFDALRKKIPLGDEKPTFAMLTNTQKLKSKEKPIADLAIVTLEKCRSSYAPVYAMQTPQANALIQGIQRRQDDLVALLYNGKITFGDFNVGMNDLNGKLSEAFFGTPSPSKPAPQSPQPTLAAATQPTAVPLPAARQAAVFAGKRLALVIGNSNYTKLPKLLNPANDARSVAEILQKMGYETHLLLDGSDQAIRNEVRKFASGSSNADVAVVYYAGHGAQLNGSNYLLPTDTDIPRTEADIQFAGLKVDDLVNSIGSNTKIIFLDACRDNPALFKNIVAGRGSTPIGLAPAAASNLNQGKAGGGVFIAYATDAGAVADDGRGQHSPFTQALLRYIQKPVSIDDMFSLVTREVRLVTKNAQRPYKYASLENIICLTPACSDAPATAPTDIVQQVKQSEGDELQIALQTKSVDALETYLQKYPDSEKRDQILGEIATLKRSQMTEWTLFEIGNQRFPQWLQLNSIQHLGDRAAIRMKRLVDDTQPKEFYGRKFPDAAYLEELNVYDCSTLRMANANTDIYNKSGELLFHYKWGDPQFLNLGIGIDLQPRSVGSTAQAIACREELGTPVVSREQISRMKFRSLSSTTDGNGEILYEPGQIDPNVPYQIAVVAMTYYFADHNIKENLPAGYVIPDPPNYRTEVNHVLIKCDENKYLIDRAEFWDSSNQLVRMAINDPTIPVSFADFGKFSTFANFQEMFCGKGYAGLGIRLSTDNNIIKVAEVFSGSPAEKAGLRAGDIITQMDRAPVSGLTLQQVIEKARGPASTKIDLTISRQGEATPRELIVTRGNIQQQSGQLGP